MIDIDNWNKVINDSAIRGYEEELEKKDILLRNKNKEIEKLKKETLSHHTKLIIAKGKQKVAEERINKALELNMLIDAKLKITNCSAYYELEDLIFKQYLILKGEDKE